MKKIQVFVKDVAQQQDLSSRYPSIDAEYINVNVPNGGLEDFPLVCAEIEGRDKCEVGEKYMQILNDEVL